MKNFLFKHENRRYRLYKEFQRGWRAQEADNIRVLRVYTAVTLVLIGLLAWVYLHQ